MPNVSEEQLKRVKRHLNITWEDEETDAKIIDMMTDAEPALNHKLGAELDYSAPGAERRLYLDYLLYAWNGCLNEFDSAYMAEIYQLRHKHAVRRQNETEQIPDI